MKLFKYGLRLLVAAFSVLGFFGGWALFAHANKPAPAQSPSVISSPAPLNLPSLLPDIGTAPGLQPLPSLPPQSLRVAPRLRTRGS